MGKVRTLILLAPGTNCDVETEVAFQQAGAETFSVHIGELIRRKKRLSDYHIMVIPGGFTYGDDISAGKVLANELRLKLGEDIERFVNGGGLILGICNGFQVLVKASILPELSNTTSSSLTLSVNDSGRFECRWVYLSVNQESPCVFTKGIAHMYLPVAHGEGKVVVPRDIGLARGLSHLNAVLYYSDEHGNTNAGYPYNPNGSVGNIAGICDSSGRIFGLMPHPERHIRGTQHPQWTRSGAEDYGDGFQVFLNAVKWAGNYSTFTAVP
jgi:phosphoribosylformylglycinamidine synthase